MRRASKLQIERDFLAATLKKIAEELEGAEAGAKRIADRYQPDEKDWATRSAYELGCFTATTKGVAADARRALASVEPERVKLAVVKPIAPLKRTTPQTSEQMETALRASLDEGRAS